MTKYMLEIKGFKEELDKSALKVQKMMQEEILGWNWVSGDSGYDEYARGTLAGEIFGKPTPKNILRPMITEEMWKDKNYGYYQEVCNEVKREIT